ncbi:MAG: hypothetical protein HS111_03725 [Kofleriaceae bacterium]|nr:hypothetical protein [Kofleriaceae bacterium]
MIRPDKQDAALYALNSVLVRARMMAFQQEPHDKIAKVLDVAELLPMLIARRDDTTAEFRLHLEGLLSVDPAFGAALERFDS